MIPTRASWESLRRRPLGWAGTEPHQDQELSWGRGGLDPDPDSGGKGQWSKWTSAGVRVRVGLVLILTQDGGGQLSKWKAFPMGRSNEKLRSGDCLCLERSDGHFSWMQ